MRKNTANVAGVRHHAEMSSSRRQSRVQKNTAKVQAYQRWIMTRPAEFWDECVERKHANAFRFSADARYSAAIVQLGFKQRAENEVYEGMVIALLDLLCEIDGLEHKWEFPLVADAAAKLLAQMKRLGGSKAAWAHKQNATKIAREAYKLHETLLVRV